MDLLKLDISGCDLESSAVSALGRLRLCELGLWGGTDSAADGVAAMADGLLRQQQSGSLGPIKLRLVQCTLNATAEAAIEQLELVPPPPPPPSAPGEEYEQGGIPIVTCDDTFSICRAVRLANPKSITIAEHQ